MKYRIFSKKTGASARQCGYSLIEVLIAVIVLAVGLLGIAGLQVFSIKNTHSAYYRSQATLLAYDIIDSIRANPDAISNYGVGLTAPAAAYATCMGTSASCSKAQMAAYDLWQWKCSLGTYAGAGTCNTSDLVNISGQLPSGDASVSVSGNDVTVTVQWTDKDERENASTADEKLTKLEITTRIE